MPRFETLVFLAATAIPATLAIQPATAGTVEVWGDARILDPEVLQGFVQIVSNGDHNVGRRADGSVACWGGNGAGECEVPADLPPCTHVAAGFDRTMAVTAAGTIVSWGLDFAGEGAPPPDNADFIAVAAGTYYSLGLKSDGSLVAWGFSYFGGDAVPEPNTDWVAVAAFDEQSVGLKSDGTVHLWGEINLTSSAPDSVFVKIAAGYAQALALTENGSIVHFGLDYQGSAAIPEPNTGFVDLAVGDGQALGLKADGSIVGWGWNHHGQAAPAPPNSGYVAVACGYFHSLGLRDDGTVEVWGSNVSGQCGVRPPLADPVAISARNDFGLVLGAAGSIATWGAIDPPPESAVPYTAVAAAYQGAAALRADGTIVIWGDWSGNSYADFEPNSGFIAVSGGFRHVAGLRDDGSIDIWGGGLGSVHTVPEPNSGFVAVSAGPDFTVALRTDGSVVAWGVDNGTGRLDVPPPDSTFVDVLAGAGFGIALRSDGTAVVWGDHFTIPPQDNHDLAAVDAQGFATVAALRTDGSLVIWTSDEAHGGIPEPNAGFTAVTACVAGVAAIRGGHPTAVEMPLPGRRAGDLTLATSPNPFNPRVAVTVRSPHAGPVTLEVIDLRGRRVRTLWRGSLPAGGVTTAQWDGQDAHGQAMPSGTYLVQARSPAGARTVRKVALVR